MLVVVVVVILTIMLLRVAGEANDPIPSSIPFPYNNKSLASKHGGDQHNSVPINMHCLKILAPLRCLALSPLFFFFFWLFSFKPSISGL